uniref:MSLN protein n=1 Tax=Catharus ustulatus TaxID=91951 RepID=A0A8C3VEQ5_CATUS
VFSLWCNPKAELPAEDGAAAVPEVILPSQYPGSCRQFFTRLGKAEPELLPRAAPRRHRLLLEALQCLVLGKLGTEEDAEVLGWLVCELGGQHIRSSGGSLLRALSRCGSFLPEQGEAIRDILSSGLSLGSQGSVWAPRAQFGLPGLSLGSQGSVWAPRARFGFPGRFGVSSTLGIFQPNPKQPQDSEPRARDGFNPEFAVAAAGCPADKEITEKVLDDDLMPTFYTPEELRACLRNASLESHFSKIFSYPFSIPQLQVLKDYLDQTYPEGYPEILLPNLGDLLDLVTPENISSWRLNSADALAAFLSNEKLSNAQVGPWLWFWGGFLMPNKITPNKKKEEHPRCVISPSPMDFGEILILCRDPAQLLWALPPSDILLVLVPEGAPGADLKALSRDNVNMNVSTFVTLRRDALMLLTPREVQGLLGLNLPELAQWQFRAPVQDWIRLQKQSELDKLEIGLTGGTQEGYINLVTPKFPGSSGLLMVGFEWFILGLQKGLKVFKECRAVLESHWEHPC